VIHQVAEADDPRIAAYAHVGDHAWLIRHGLFVAEGRLVVERLIDDGRYDIHSVLVTPAAVDPLHARFARLSADIYVAHQSLLHAVTGFNFHRGCLALVRRPEPVPLERFLSARRMLLLEGVGNPDNVGGLFRVAAALGADGVLLDSRSADPLYRKAVRTSMGTVLRVSFAQVDEWTDALTTLAVAGFRLIALTPDSSARTLSELADTGRYERVALMLGAEGPGLSADTLGAAHERARIPIARGVDSLNVVVAAAIALYAMKEQG
jgi:tRNA G18 (ribose-2'-O)-methylase SpoU